MNTRIRQGVYRDQPAVHPSIFLTNKAGVYRDQPAVHPSIFLICATPDKHRKLDVSKAVLTRSHVSHSGREVYGTRIVCSNAHFY